MKSKVFKLLLLILTVSFSSCDKEEKTNFYNLEHRIGLWINAGDTLEFINSSKVIRKGSTYTYEEYLYRIENSTLIISLPDYEDIETFHSILKADENMVHLGNMYIGVSSFDGSGTFRKK